MSSLSASLFPKPKAFVIVVDVAPANLNSPPLIYGCSEPDPEILPVDLSLLRKCLGNSEILLLVLKDCDSPTSVDVLPLASTNVTALPTEPETLSVIFRTEQDRPDIS